MTGVQTCALPIFISGEEEATLDFIGASHNLDINQGVLIDIGGGSTELVSFKDMKMETAASISIGSLNLYLKHVDALLPTSKERKRIEKTVLKEFAGIKNLKGVTAERICGIGGTIRGTLKLCNDIFNLSDSNKIIEVNQLDIVLDMLRNADKTTIRRIIQAVPERIHTIIPGMIELAALAKILESKQIIVSKYGVREGYLYKYVLKEVI